MTGNEFIFAILAISTALCAVGVVLSQNVVRAAVWLLFTLIGVSLLYFFLGAEFLGASQLIVYVGGTLVLVVFGVMLTAQGPFLRLRTKPSEWVLAGIVGTGMFALLVYGSFQFAEHLPQSASDSKAVEVGELGLNFMNLPSDISPTSNDRIPGSQTPLRTANAYLLPFEILSVHLLVVLIGAAYLARAKRKSPVSGKEIKP
jgi:NADH-quinone oxidoreductase subunit J